MTAKTSLTISILLLSGIVTLTRAVGDEVKREAGGTYLDFITALVSGDWATARRLSLPNPDWHLLEEAGPMPAVIREPFLSGIREHGYKVLEEGMAVSLGDGLEIQLSAELRDEGGVIVTSAADPLPHILRRVDGKWLADAGDLIALRKDWVARGVDADSNTAGEEGEQLDPSK